MTDKDVNSEQLTTQKGQEVRTPPKDLREEQIRTSTGAMQRPIRRRSKNR